MEEVGTDDVKLARDMNITGSLYVLIGRGLSLPYHPPKPHRELVPGQKISSTDFMSA